MKKSLLTFSLAAICLSSNAQRIKVEDAAIYLRTPETTLEDAKKAIDDAAVHPDTKDELKTWYYRTAVYDTIYANANYASLDKDVEEKYFQSCKKCIDLDIKKKYKDYCAAKAIFNTAFGCYNKGVDLFTKKDYANATKFFNYVLDIVQHYDPDNVLVKNNISEKNLTESLADLAILSGNKGEATGHLQKLIDMDYNKPDVYIKMANLFLEDKDTTKALSFIDKGRKRFPGDKDIIMQELYIYQEGGKTELLLKKYDEALELNPENTLFLYNRGTTLDNLARTALEKNIHYKDTIQKMNKAVSVEKNPLVKAKYNASIRLFNNLADSFMNVSKGYTAKTEADYYKAIDVNPDYLDAYFNLGALINNKTTEIVEKMNSLKAPTQAEYEKKFAVYKKVQDSILTLALKNFLKANDLIDAMPEKTDEDKKEKRRTTIMILHSMQQVYANLGDEKKTVETKLKRMLIELPGEKKSKVIANMGEPKDTKKTASDSGKVIETWIYENLQVNMVNGVVQDVLEIKK